MTVPRGRLDLPGRVARSTSRSLSALAVADGVVSYDGLRFVPDTLMDDPEDTKAGLREAYGRLAAELEFDNLLVAHGDPVVGGAREALREFSEHDRARDGRRDGGPGARGFNARDVDRLVS